MKIRPKYRNSISLKLIVFSVSLFASLALLEAGLRLTGYALASSRESEHLPPYLDNIPDADYAFERYGAKRGKERLILTLGDSLTNAGNVKSYNSYPYYLYRRYADAGERAAVYNMAKCEESTFGVAHKLKSYLAEHRDKGIPDVVVILVGAADLFNLPLVRKKMKDDGTRWREILPTGWIYDLRIAKVLRHIRMNLFLRRGSEDGDSEEGVSMADRLEVLLEVYEAYKAKKGPSLDPALVRKVRDVFGEGETEHDDLKIERPGDFVSFLADYASVVYTPQVRYDQLFSLLLDMVATFPSEFWTPEFDTAGYFLVQTYPLQSKFTARDVLKVMDRSLAGHPELKENPSYMNFRKYLAERRQMDVFIDQKRAETWAEIVSMTRAHGIRLVLQTYPVEYSSANDTLRAVSAEYGLPLIDNQKHFSDLIRENSREAYLEDNDHMTPAGYEILAENVYKGLAQ